MRSDVVNPIDGLKELLPGILRDSQFNPTLVQQLVTNRDKKKSLTRKKSK